MAAWVVVEATSVVVAQFHWREIIAQTVTVLAAFGLLIVLVLAWFHGEKGRQRAGRVEILLIALVVVAAGVSVAALARSAGDSVPEATAGWTERTAIAVLPFENLTADGYHGYFAAGLHDELLTQLTKVASLRPISRTSVMRYENTTLPIRTIARQLGAGTVVEGSVQLMGRRLRVHVQLIDAATDTHIWAERYDRTLDDAFAIQTDIARRVVAAVGGALTASEANALEAGGTQNPEAYRRYLQANEYAHRPGNLRENLAIAQDLYEQAVALDPGFALAWAALSYLHGIVYWYAYDPSPVRRRLQRTAARTALRIAPDLPDAHRAMVYVHYYGEMEYETALRDATELLDRLPGSARVWATVGYLHRRLGNWDEVLAAFETTTVLDPLNEGHFTVLGGDTYKFLHRYDEAVAAYDRALTLAPDHHGARLRRAWAFLLSAGAVDTLRVVLENGPDRFGDLGSNQRWRAQLALWERDPVALLRVIPEPERVTFDARLAYEPGLLYAGWAHRLMGDDAAAAEAFDGALAQLDSVLAQRPDDWRVHASRGVALAALGRDADAEVACRTLRESPVYDDRFSRPVLDEACGLMFAQSGRVEQALAEVEPLVTGPSWTSAQLMRIDPRWDPIRDDPRFRALVDGTTGLARTRAAMKRGAKLHRLIRTGDPTTSGVGRPTRRRGPTWGTT